MPKLRPIVLVYLSGVIIAGQHLDLYLMLQAKDVCRENISNQLLRPSPPNFGVPVLPSTTSRPQWDWLQTTPSSAESSNSSEMPNSCIFSKECSDMVCNSDQIQKVPTEEIPDELTMFRLSQTRIESLDADVFMGKSIEAIVIEDNPLRCIAEDAFQGLSDLRYLVIRGNNLWVDNHQMDNFFTPFRDLNELEVLILDHNQLNLIGVGKEKKGKAIGILPSIALLSMRSNPLRRIEEHFFTPLLGSVLKRLDLQSGSLEYIHPRAFDPLEELMEVNLYNNYKLFQVTSQDKPLPHFGLAPLRALLLGDFGANLLTGVPWDHLAQINKTLTHLSLSQNVFIELGMTMGIHGGKNTFPLMAHVRALALDGCRIQDIHPRAFENLPKLESLSLKQNPLFTIPPAALISTLGSLYMEGFDEMFVDGDQFYLKEELFTKFQLMGNLHTLSITFVHMEQLTARCFLGLEALTTLVLDHCVFESIENGAFSALKNLQELSLYSSQGLDEVPVELLMGPLHLTTLDLTNIPITSGNPRSVMAKSAASRCMGDYPLDKVQILNLTGSLINLDDPLDYLALDSMPHLEVLNISQNRIISWDSTKFHTNPRMRVLQVTQNHDIISLTAAMLEDMQGLELIDFTDSVFECNQYVPEFLRMASNFSLTITNWNLGYGYFCRKINGSKMSFRDFSETGLDLDDGIHLNPTKNYTTLITSLVLSMLGLTFIVFLLNVGYKNRWYFEYQWAKRNIQKKRKQNASDSSFLYHTFISYNSEDRDLVQGFLLPSLENEDPKLSVCVHERDFVVGHSIIENIVTCLEASRTCIIVLSKDYAKSEWCRFEAQMALRMFQEDERTSKMIVVIVRNKIPGSHLTKTLRSIIKLRTYLEWMDPTDGYKHNLRALNIFFKRLRFALNCLAPSDESVSISDTDLLSFY